MSKYLDTVSTLELYAMLGVCETDRALSEADQLEMAECAKRIRVEIERRKQGRKVWRLEVSCAE